MNFQQIPRQNKLIKQCFLPKLDAFASWDYEQIEYRIFAYYAHEAAGGTTMAEVFKAGEDLHKRTAELLLGRPPRSDNERQIGKHTNYSIIFSGGVPAVLRQMSKGGVPCTEDQARKWLKILRTEMPEIRELNEMIMDEIQDKGYIFDLFGRHYHPDPTIPWRDAVRKLLSALIQGCAAGLTRSSLVNIHKGSQGMQSHLVNVVHDDVLLDVVTDEIGVLAEKVPGWMGNKELERVVPITVEMKVSTTNWAEMENYE